MDAYRLVIAPKFAADLTAIHDRIAKDSPANAVRVASRIMDALEPLLTVPHRAPIEPQPPGLRHPVRSVAVPPYIIYFRAVEADKVVRVLRVRHGARRRLRWHD